jgi:hypothetical protein
VAIGLLSLVSIHRLAINLPSGWPFIVVCVALRFIEGVGTALFLTAGYTLITQLYPKSTGFIVVYRSKEKEERLREDDNITIIMILHSPFHAGNSRNWYRCWLCVWTSDWRIPLQGI